ncbi:MAG: NUDIX domain-containing protein [Pseudomonadales bacterium]|nr:NUDIX domain-containing protein [Pseudomonadales bacterium]
MKKFQQQDVHIVAENLAFDGFFKLKTLTLKHALFAGGQSSEIEREVCIRGDAVGILLYDPVLQQFALVEQLRIGVLGREQSPWLLELVAGMLDKENEDPVDVARRETLEEAGLTVQAIKPVMQYFCSPGGSTEYFSLFCGKVDLQDIKSAVFGVADENEDIRLHILAVDDVISRLNAGQLNNSMTIIALQWFQLNKPMLDDAWLNT